MLLAILHLVQVTLNLFKLNNPQRDVKLDKCTGMDRFILYSLEYPRQPCSVIKIKARNYTMATTLANTAEKVTVIVDNE